MNEQLTAQLFAFADRAVRERLASWYDRPQQGGGQFRLTDKGRIQVRIASDGLTAFADVVPGAAAGPADLTHALQRAGVTFGVDEGACAELGEALVDERFAVKDRAVARGRRPTSGGHGYFAPSFEQGVQPGHLGADGMMDFRDRELLKVVHPGDVVGALHPAVRGAPGTKVDGTELPVPPVRDVQLQIGAGLSLRADQQVEAKVAGVLVYVPQKSIEITQHHVHRGHVDLRSGHLEMEGSLTVYGDVHRQFFVRASGDIDIQGMVDGGCAYAGGSLRIKGLVRGGEDGALLAQGDMSVRAAERAQLTAEHLLTVETATHSTLAAETIHVGTVRGGEARAELSIVADEAGLPHGGETVLAVAVPLDRAELDVRKAVELAKEQRLALQRASRGNPERARGGKVGRATALLQREELERRVELGKRREQLLKTAHVIVRGVAHPEVLIQVGPARLPIVARTSQVRFSFDPETRLVRSERLTP